MNNTSNIRAKKSLGQHFLRSKYILGRIVETAKIKEGDQILEIGPGTGILTEELLRVGAHVLAIEKDIRAIETLKENLNRFITLGKLNLIEGDILKEKIPFEEGKYSIVANIPYYITGAILERFLEHSPRPIHMVLLVQKEVAERIVARDGKESILSLSVKAFGTPKIISKVPKNAFSPAPNVDSAILEIENIGSGNFNSVKEINNFFRILKTGFSHKRKMLINNLVEIFDKNTLEKAWKDMKIDKKERAENISLDKWTFLAKLLKEVLEKQYQ